MQSKGKAFILLLALALIGLFVAASLHEPTLEQTTAEEALDASRFSQ